MHINRLQLYVDKDERLVMIKEKYGKQKDIFAFILLPLIIIIAVISQANRLPTEPWFYFLVIIILAILIANMFFSMKLSELKHKDYYLETKNERVYINDMPFCNQMMLDAVVLREKSGENTNSYHVGINSGNDYLFLTFYQNLQEASAIAGVLAHYLQTEIKTESSRKGMFTFHEYLSLNR